MSFAGFELPDELEMLRQGVRRFVQDEIRPVADALPPEALVIPRADMEKIQLKAKKADYWLFGAPAEYGGQGLSAFWLAVVTEEMAKHRFSIHGWEGTGPFGPGVPLVLLRGSQYLRERYGLPTLEKGLVFTSSISEPTGGSDPARAIRTTAVRRGDTYVINGRKMWTTHGDIADYLIVYARTDKGAGRQGISAFVVDGGSPGMEVTPIPVIRDYHTTEIVFEDCEVPVENRVGEEGDGFGRAQETLVAGRMTIAATCLGIAEEALRMTIEWVKQRETFEAPLAQRQAVQFAIADALIDIKATRWLTWEAAWAADQGKDARVATSIAKLQATEMASRVLDMAMQFHGGLGLARALPLERWFRGVRVWRIGEGPSEIHRYLIARDILGSAATGKKR